MVTARRVERIGVGIAALALAAALCWGLLASDLPVSAQEGTPTPTPELEPTAITVSIADAAPITEGETATFTVSLSAAADADVPLTWQAGDASGTATIPTGDLSAAIAVATEQDAVDEDDETLTVTIALGDDAPDGVTIATNTAAAVVSDDDDAPSAPFAFVSFVLNDTDVELSWTASESPGQLDGAAATVTRYEYDIDGDANWRDAGLASPFTVSGLDTAANTYAFRLRAVNAVGAGPALDAATVTATLVPAALPAVAHRPRVNEGEAVTFLLSLPGGPAAADIAITWTAAGSGDNPATPGDDFAASGTATLAAGSDSTQFDVATMADAVAEEDETFAVSIVLGGMALPASTVTIANVIPADPVPPGAPSAPTDYRALVAEDSGGVSLLWGPPADPGEFEGEPALVTGFEYSVDGGPWQPTTPGALGHVVPGLSSAAGHTFRLRALNHAGAGAPTPPFEVSRVAFAHGTGFDHDLDNDHLIEITNLEQLAAISHNLYGSWQGNHGNAFPSPKPNMGCKDHVCQGYELTKDLDFLDPDSYASGRVNNDWTSNAQWRSGGKGWTPIGLLSGGNVGYLETTFEGNGYTISNLYIHRTTRDFLGLFTAIGERGTVRNLGLFSVNIQGQTGAYQYAGGLAGFNHGNIWRTWVTGDVKGSREVGGLVGGNRGNVTSSYSHAYVEGSSYQVGGLVGRNEKDAIVYFSYATGSVHGAGAHDVGGLVGLHKGSQDGQHVLIRNSYATGKVTLGPGGARRGGLIGGGSDFSRVQNSYFDYETAGFSASDQFAQSSRNLRFPNANSNPTPFSAWDDDPTRDAWDFGSDIEYPALKVDFNGDNTASWQEFGYQRPGLHFSPTEVALNEGETGQYTVRLTMPTHQDETVTVLIGREAGNYAPVRVRQGGVDLHVGSIYFNRHDFNKPQTITVAALQDADSRDEAVILNNVVSTNQRKIGHYRGSFPTLIRGQVNVTVADDETPAIIVAPDTLRMFTGESQSYTVKLSEQPTQTVTVLVGRADPENVATLSATGRGAPHGQYYLDFTPDNWDQPQTVTVTGQLRTGANAPTYPSVRTLTHTVHASDPHYANAAAVTVEATILVRPTGGLIPIRDLEELNAVRWDLDGNGQADPGVSSTNRTAYAAAFSADARSCAPTCSGYELLTNLDFKDPASYASGQVNTAWTGGNGWAPIGSTLGSNSEFAGAFHGGGHTISNLFINRDVSTGVGLFAAIGLAFDETPAHVKDLKLERAIVQGTTIVGALAGSLQHKAKITNSSVANGSRIRGGTDEGDKDFGGLVGFMYDATVENSYAEIDYVGGEDNLGGLVGTMQRGSTITGSYAINNDFRNGVSGTKTVGGLVGWMDSSTVQNSYARMKRMRAIDQTGGLAGHVSNGSTITDSHASIAFLVSSSSQGGGLVGLLESSTVRRSYAASSLSIGGDGNYDYAGGLVGRATGSDIISSYAQVNIVPSTDVTAYQANYIGGLVGSHEADDDVDNAGDGAAGGGIIASYATGRIVQPHGVTFGDAVAGLVGYLRAGSGQGSNATNARIVTAYATVSHGSGVYGVIGKRYRGTIWHPYFDGDVNLATASDELYPGTAAAAHNSTTALQSPTGYTGIYANWDVTESGGVDIGNTADFWHFGANDDYPALNGPTGDGLTWKDFGYQLREGPTLTAPVCMETRRVDGACPISGDALTLNWTPVDVSHWPSDPPAISYFLYRDGQVLAKVDGVANTQYVDATIDPNKTHEYQVMALVNGLPGRPGNVLSIKVSRIPSLPQVPDQTYTQGIPIEPLQMPRAEGGDPPLEYEVYNDPDNPFPPGLMPKYPDDDTSNPGVISGTPTAAGTYEMRYRVRETTTYKVEQTDGMILDAYDINQKGFTITVLAPDLPGTTLPLSPQVETRSVRENARPGLPLDGGGPLTPTGASLTNLTYSLLDYEDDDDFTVDTDGVLRTKDGVTYDYETKSLYVLAVQICSTDPDAPDDPEVCEPPIGVNVKVIDLPPPLPPPNLVVTARDQTSLSLRWDPPNNQWRPGLPPILGYKLVYWVEDGVGPQGVELPVTPTTTVLTELAPDTNYCFQMQAGSVEGYGSLTSKQCSSTLLPNHPYFTSSAAFIVPENTTAVGTVTALDGSMGDRTMSYTIGAQDHGDRFDINANTGELSFKMAPDFETPVCATPGNPSGNTCTLQVVATSSSSDAGEPDYSATQEVTVTVTDVPTPEAPAAPVAAGRPNNRMQVNWQEPYNAGPPITKYEIRHKLKDDADFVPANVRVYTPLSGRPPSPPEDFTVTIIDSSSVQLSWAASANPGLLDSGEAATILGYQYEIDGNDDWREAGLTSPFIVSGLDTDNNTYVFRLRARHAQNVSDPVIGDGPESVNRPRSFGVYFGSLLAGTEYEYQVRAISSEGASPWSDSGFGRTLAVGGPSFTSAAEFTVPENTATVGTLTASGDPTPVITLTGGPDRDKFVLSADNVLSFKEDEDDPLLFLPDFDNPGDADRDNRYVVIAQAAITPGDGLLADQTIIVTVTDAGPPEAPAEPQAMDPTLYTITLQWNAPENGGPDIVAYDVQYGPPDDGEGATSVAASTEEDPDGPVPATEGGSFIHNVNEGTATTVTVQNLEENTQYGFRVRAHNTEGVSPWSPRAAAATTSNDAPYFAAIPTFEVWENTTAVGTVTATDDDAEDSITGYTIAGADAAKFGIDNAGVLSFNTAPDFEAPGSADGDNTYEIELTATSGTGEREETTAPASVTITVLDVGPKTPAAPTVTVASATSLTVTWTAPTVVGPAIDDYDVQYREKDSGPFMDKAHDGTALTTTITGLDEDQTYEVRVQAKAGPETSPWSDSSQVGNHPPQFTSPNIFTVEENTTAPVGTVQAEDTDNEDSITDYSITGGADMGHFTIAAATGVLTFNNPPDFELPGDADNNNVYTFEVTATGGTGARALTATQTITVTVIDADTESQDAPIVDVSDEPPVDYDLDDNGLIEITNRTQLNAVRYDLNGNGVADNTADEAAYAAAFPRIMENMCGAAFTETAIQGNPGPCVGYELATDITLSGSWTPVGGNVPRNSDAPQSPVGAYNAVFEGNGNTISGLRVNLNSSYSVGLFGVTSPRAVIKNVCLENVNVRGDHLVGALVGQNRGTVVNSCSTGQVHGNALVGGLVGWNRGAIRRSYSQASVTGFDYTDRDSPSGTIQPVWSTQLGGLVGGNYGTMEDTYATGDVTGVGHVAGLTGSVWNNGVVRRSYSTGPPLSDQGNSFLVGGLVGWIFGGTVESGSYWNTETSGSGWDEGFSQINWYGVFDGDGKTTDDLQDPTGATGIYAFWDANVWNFRSANDYPCLAGVGTCPGEAVQDNDGAQMNRRVGVTVAAANPLAVGEGGAADYQMSLAGRPTGYVTVTVSSNNGDVSARPSSLTFTPGNWDTPQTVSVRAAHDDDAADDDATLSHAVRGADEYAGIAADAVAVAVSDDDTASVTVHPTRVSLPEGWTGSYGLSLSHRPVGDVQIHISSDNPDVAPYPDPIIFTPDNWQTEQLVGVPAAHDDDTADDVAVILHAILAAPGSGYDGAWVDGVIVSITDDDEATAQPAQQPEPEPEPEPGSVTVSATDMPIREGAAATYTVILDVEPTGNVVITVSSDNGDVTTQPSQLTFTTGNWQSAQTVSVSAGQDGDKADDTATLSHSASGGNYDGVAVASVTVSVTDDDSDRAALEAFYQATGGHSWTNIGNWLSDQPLNQWHGVTANGSGQVTHLSLRDNGLSGSLPAALGKLESLQVLSLDRNSISGSLPSELGNLSNLTRLAMNRNSLNGAIPSELGRLFNLSIIGLANNSLSGSLPASVGNLSGLTKLSLHDNTGLSGPLPSGFTNLANLQRLAIANTGLCAPNGQAFTDWLDSVDDLTPDPVPACASP